MEPEKKKEETISISKSYYNELTGKKTTSRDLGKLKEITKKELDELIKIQNSASDVGNCRVVEFDYGPEHYSEIFINPTFH